MAGKKNKPTTAKAKKSATTKPSKAKNKPAEKKPTKKPAEQKPVVAATSASATNQAKPTKPAEGSWLDIIKTFTWALIIATIFRTFLFQPFHIPSSSMKPNLLIGDFVIASQYSYGYSKHSFPFVSLPLFEGRVWYTEPKRGDIVIFKVPSKSFGQDVLIKRLVGLPGDRLQMNNGVLFINEKPVGLVDAGTFLEGVRNLKKQHETLPNGVNYDILDADEHGIVDNTPVYLVPEGNFFMIGDNRDNSSDSRFATPGFVPAENLIARAEFVLISSKGWLINPLEWRADRFFKSLRY